MTSSQCRVIPSATASSFELKYRKNVARPTSAAAGDRLDGRAGQATLGDQARRAGRDAVARDLALAHASTSVHSFRTMRLRLK